MNLMNIFRSGVRYYQTQEFNRKTDICQQYGGMKNEKEYEKNSDNNLDIKHSDNKLENRKSIQASANQFIINVMKNGIIEDQYTVSRNANTRMPWHSKFNRYWGKSVNIDAEKESKVISSLKKIKGVKVDYGVAVNWDDTANWNGLHRRTNAEPDLGQAISNKLYDPLPNLPDDYALVDGKLVQKHR